MCTDSAGHLVMEDEKIQDLMSNPILELIHKQVIMTLYSLDADHRLNECKELLPIYLSLDWNRCCEILNTIQAAGLLVRTETDIRLTHPIEIDGMNSCGCH
jgi:hypothetical protein